MKQKLVTILFTITPHHLVSRCVGWLAHTKISWIKNTFIRQYITFYQVDMTQALVQDPTQFDNFNAFFTRELAGGARELDSNLKHLICPVDGAVSELGTIEHDQLLQAKGHHFSLSALLANDQWADRLQDGLFNTLYLAPKDYHRIHMPIRGKLLKMTYVPGRLFSVNQTSVQAIDQLFARNERVVCYFETELGMMVMVLVGALIVGSIKTVWSGVVTPAKIRQVQTWDYADQNIELDRGAEMGAFQLGSTVILLFEKKRIQWDGGLTSNTPVKMGQCLALTQ